MELHIRDVSKTYSNGVQALAAAGNPILTADPTEGPRC